MRKLLRWCLSSLAAAMTCLPLPAESRCVRYEPPHLLMAVTRCNPVRYVGTELEMTKRGALMDVRVLAVWKLPVLGDKAEPAPAHWQPGTQARVFVSGNGARLCALTLGQGAPIMVAPVHACCDVDPCRRHGPSTHTAVSPVWADRYAEPPGEEELAERARVRARLEERSRLKWKERARDRCVRLARTQDVSTFCNAGP
jgi:hypothetical protein